LRDRVNHPLDTLSADEFTPLAEIVRRVPRMPFGFFDRNPSPVVVGTPPDTCRMESTSAGH